MVRCPQMFGRIVYYTSWERDVVRTIHVMSSRRYFWGLWAGLWSCHYMCMYRSDRLFVLYDSHWHSFYSMSHVYVVQSDPCQSLSQTSFSFPIQSVLYERTLGKPRSWRTSLEFCHSSMALPAFITASQQTTLKCVCASVSGNKADTTLLFGSGKRFCPY